MLSTCGGWRRLLRVPGTARRSNQCILREINPEYSLEELMLKLKLQYFGHLMRRTDLLEKTLMLGKSESRMRRSRKRMRWLDSINGYSMDISLSKLWEMGRTGKPGMLLSMGLQRAGHDWMTEQQQSLMSSPWTYQTSFCPRAFILTVTSVWNLLLQTSSWLALSPSSSHCQNVTFCMTSWSSYLKVNTHIPRPSVVLLSTIALITLQLIFHLLYPLYIPSATESPRPRMPTTQKVLSRYIGTKEEVITLSLFHKFWDEFSCCRKKHLEGRISLELPCDQCPEFSRLSTMF